MLIRYCEQSIFFENDGLSKNCSVPAATVTALLCSIMSASLYIADDPGAIAHLFQYANLIALQANEGLEGSNNAYEMQRHYDRLEAILARLLQIQHLYDLTETMNNHLSEWISSCMNLIQKYVSIADAMEEDIQMMESSIPETIRLPIELLGAGPGRKKLKLNLTDLPLLLQQQYKLKEIAALSGISERTLRRPRIESGSLLRHQMPQTTGNQFIKAASVCYSNHQRYAA